jgi:hypothetical protein
VARGEVVARGEHREHALQPLGHVALGHVLAQASLASRLVQQRGEHGFGDRRQAGRPGKELERMRLTERPGEQRVLLVAADDLDDECEQVDQPLADVAASGQPRRGDLRGELGQPRRDRQVDDLGAVGDEVVERLARQSRARGDLAHAGLLDTALAKARTGCRDDARALVRRLGHAPILARRQICVFVVAFVNVRLL